MLLNSVILVLQETLEAALLVTVLLAIGYQQRYKNSWLFIGIFVGVILSVLYAGSMDEISEWFDNLGQEIINALLQGIITLFIVFCTWAISRRQWHTNRQEAAQYRKVAFIFMFCAATTVALAITRESYEILLYLSGFFRQKDYFQTVMVGSSLGFGIGLSFGVLFYYGLLALPDKWRLDIPVVFLALFAGNMLSQAVLQLTQADWISSAGAIWDSSQWLPENSLTGQLLYALVGYEATPSAAQVFVYIIGVLLVLVSRSAGRYTMRSHTGKIHDVTHPRDA